MGSSSSSPSELGVCCCIRCELDEVLGRESEEGVDFAGFDQLAFELDLGGRVRSGSHGASSGRTCLSNGEIRAQV